MINSSDGFPYITASVLNSEHKALCVETRPLTFHTIISTTILATISAGSKINVLMLHTYVRIHKK